MKRVLVIDTETGQKTARRFSSGPKLTPRNHPPKTNVIGVKEYL
jgi:hypothetical protein